MSARPAEGEYDPKDYLPVSSKDIEQMYEDLKKYIAKIQNPYLQELTASYYLRDEDFIRRFKGSSLRQRPCTTDLWAACWSIH